MRKIEWKSLLGVSYKLEIADGSNTVTELTAGATPFVTATDDSEDIWEPVRASSGNIQIVGDVSDLDGLVQGTPGSRAVVLKKVVGSTETVMWKGFLQTTAFSQAWDRGPLEIDIPVTSGLGILGGFYPYQTSSAIHYYNFAQFLYDMNLANNQTALWDYFVFPKLTDPLTTLVYNFNFLNYYTHIRYGKWESVSYLDILTDICKFFGWQAQEVGDTLVFMAVDGTTGYIKMPYSELYRLAQGQQPTYQDIAHGTVTETIWGASHSVNYVDGKKKVIVRGNVNPFDETIWEFDFDNYAIGNTRGANLAVGDTRQWFYSKDYANQQGIWCRNANDNIRYQSWYNDIDFRGWSMVTDRLLEAQNRTGAVPTVDTGWKGHFVFQLKNLVYQTEMATVSVELQYRYTSLLAGKFLKFKMNVKRCRSDFGDWENYTGKIIVSVKIGGTEILSSPFFPITDGELQPVYASTVGLLDGYCIACPNLTGTLKVTFTVPAATGHEYSDGWDEGDFDYYYCIEDFSISYANDWTRNLLGTEKKVNEETRDVNLGYNEEYVVENGLTTYRDGEFGSGVVLGYSLTGTIPATLYSNKTAEAALADRIAAYFASSKSEVVAELKITGQMLDACKRHNIGDGKSYVCVSQQVNWVEDTVRARLCEVDPEILVGTSESLWSYATTMVSGTATYGFIAQSNMYITGVVFDCAQVPSGTTAIAIHNVGNNTPVLTQNISGVVAGRNVVRLTTPIYVQQGQIIGLRNSNVYYCEPSTKKGNYPTNSYDGVVGSFDTNPRCFRMDFYAHTV